MADLLLVDHDPIFLLAAAADPAGERGIGVRQAQSLAQARGQLGRQRVDLPRGAVFLDAITQMPIALRAYLLRALASGEPAASGAGLTLAQMEDEPALRQTLAHYNDDKQAGASALGISVHAIRNHLTRWERRRTSGEAGREPDDAA